MSAINGYGILDALKQALDDQGSPEAREGALFAFEALCEKLGGCAKHAVHVLGKASPSADLAPYNKGSTGMPA